MLNILSHRFFPRQLNLLAIISFSEDVSDIETNWIGSRTYWIGSRAYLPMEKQINKLVALDYMEVKQFLEEARAEG